MAHWEARLVSRYLAVSLKCAISEIETEDSVVVIRRVHVRLRLQAAAEHKKQRRGLHGMFAN